MNIAANIIAGAISQCTDRGVIDMARPQSSSSCFFALFYNIWYLAVGMYQQASSS